MAVPSQKCSKSFTVLDLITHLRVLSSLPPPPPSPSPSAATTSAGSMTVYVTRQSLEAARVTPPCAQPLAAAKLRTLGLSISSIRDKCHVTARREREARERVRQVE